MLSLVSRNFVARLLPTAQKINKFQNASLKTSIIRQAGANEMLQVGDWPRTKEEREKAAKKYNLIPEDYIPYEEGEALGDYPNLKPIGAFNRDPYDDYDDMVDVRFYGEVFHRDADLYYWERVDPLRDEKGYLPTWLVMIIFFSLAASMPTYYYLMDNYRIYVNHPFKQRLFHSKDQKYYEFPSSSEHH